MKIKEVETLLDIPKATIRFYEKEGLLIPSRNHNSYRDYSDEDIEVLKKIIVLRKIGMSVEDIRHIFEGTLSLQDAIDKNIQNLNNQIKEIQGAIQICSLMQNKNESIESFDEDYYMNAIKNEESKGNKFFEILSDVMTFEKKVFLDEFGLIDESGNMRFSLKTSIIIALCMCVAGGLLWFFMDNMAVDSFVEGFFFPFVCILITSVFGLPVYFLEKKNKKLAALLKKIGYAICVVITIVIILLLIFVEV